MRWRVLQRDIPGGRADHRGVLLTGEGVRVLKATLIEVGRSVGARHDTGIFRMPIDRVFTMHGFGTVVAGTVLSGVARVGDRLEVFPEGTMTKVRGIQVHSRDVEVATIGRRTAINIHNVRKEDLRRGQTLAAPGALSPTRRLDGRLHLLRSHGEELRNRTSVRLHTGTDEVIASVVLLDRDRLPPGRRARAARPGGATVAAHNNRFVIRALTPPRTIGGGVILDAARSGTSLRRGSAGSAYRPGGDIAEVVERTFLNAGLAPQTAADVAKGTGEPKESDVEKVVEALREAGKLVIVSPQPGRRYGRAIRPPQRPMTTSRPERSASSMFPCDQHPYHLWMPAASLQSKLLRQVERRVLDTVIADLSDRESSPRKSMALGSGTHIGFQPGEREAAERIEALFREAAFATPPEEDVRSALRMRAETLQTHDRPDQPGASHPALPDVTYHQQYLREARKVAADYIQRNGSVTVADCATAWA